MPVTKSEMLFFAAGAAFGAAAGANYPYLKEKFGPIIAAALAGTVLPLAIRTPRWPKRLPRKSRLSRTPWRR